ncbi:Dynein light chain 1, axonemal [Kappamyces sp. JEL0829]|nr:Dynein light chain 1, axonemal [Kappamyces sp. JEL0829]KAJ3370883.1 Dynein light chain 1, axonemal [Kappamyces sp. JEL0680]
MEALKIWEEKHPGQNIQEAQVIKIMMTQPFINKMDSSISTFNKLEQLSLSTNAIEKISNLNGLDSLRILSLGRNSIKKIEGLETVSGTLQELWLSYNLIDKLNGIECCKKLKVLYISNNKLKDWAALQPAAGLTLLEDVLFSGNPVEEKATADGNWVSEITKRFPYAKKLDGKTLIREDGLEEEKPAE